MIFNCVDYRGRRFDRFFVARDPSYGPGWYIFGRNPEYGDRLVMRCGEPDKKPRKHPFYNHRSIAGWSRKRDAEAALATLNG